MNRGLALLALPLVWLLDVIAESTGRAEWEDEA